MASDNKLHRVKSSWAKSSKIKWNLLNSSLMRFNDTKLRRVASSQAKWCSKVKLSDVLWKKSALSKVNLSEV
jgi:hypothetical protein